ncbi:hypothetical protein Pmani_021704 [Petrolisthes manimaculis]|uniref:Rho GTPase-activating protein 39 n=1 Tax=Petrolisthes manimaculis TaxID=1843537 RepID=A0AAE1PFQ3_9EUCA|nr:hypothetical protein Pmani_021704 [Petrolisthes manimaculis]
MWWWWWVTGSPPPPPKARRKKFDDNQWWELFDANTSRFYYYNATSQKTVWHRPQNCDIIPLAKLQQIKQNTEVAEDQEGRGGRIVRESIGTQTPVKPTPLSPLALPHHPPSSSHSSSSHSSSASSCSSSSARHTGNRNNNNNTHNNNNSSSLQKVASRNKIPVPSLSTGGGSLSSSPLAVPGSATRLGSGRGVIPGSVPEFGCLQRSHSSLGSRQRGVRGSLPGLGSGTRGSGSIGWGSVSDRAGVQRVGSAQWATGNSGARVQRAGSAQWASRGSGGGGGLQRVGSTQWASGRQQRWSGGPAVPHSPASGAALSLQKKEAAVSSSVSRGVTTQTSPHPSPRPLRRPSAPHRTTEGAGGGLGGGGCHHHHRQHHSPACSHHNGDASGGGGGGGGSSGGGGGSRRVRRSSQSSQGSSLSYTRPYTQESGRSSDSSVSQSRTSLEGSGYRLLESPRGVGPGGSGRGDGRRGSSRGSDRHSKEREVALSPDSVSSQSSPTHPQVAPTTPLAHRRARPDAPARHKGGFQDTPHLQVAKQRSFDGSSSSNYPRRSETTTDRDRGREVALCRSYSFMARPRHHHHHDDDAMHERFLPPAAVAAAGMRSVESTPQPRRRQKGLEAPEPLSGHGPLGQRQRSDSSGLESLATPMMHRKQRSLETGQPRMKIEVRGSPSAHTRLAASDSSPSPPSPRHQFPPLDWPRGPDSGTSTLTDQDARGHCGRGSADSSPHSQVDSGLLSGTTGSRGSIDSTPRRLVTDQDASADASGRPASLKSGSDGGGGGRRCSHRRHHHCSRHRTTNATTTTTTPAATTVTTDSDRSDTLQSSSSSQHLVHNNTHNHNSSSGSSSTTAKHTSPSNAKHISPSNTKHNPANSKQASPNTTKQTSPSTTKQPSPSNTKQLNNASNMKQMVNPITGNRQEKNNSQHQDLTHLYSNLDYVYEQPVYQYIMEQAKLFTNYRKGDALYEDGDSLHSDDSASHHHHDSDEFADDEGMSNADSSSQEYLADVDYLADDELYHNFYVAPAWKGKTKDEEDATDSNASRLTSTTGISAPTTQTPRATVTPPNTLPLDTEHPSLRRKKDSANHQPLYSPILEKAEGMSGLSLMKKPPSESDFDRYNSTNVGGGGGGGGGGEGHNLMEKYAQENLNIHTRGLLRKKVPVMDMISWTKDPIRKPMLATLDKSLKASACDMFRLVQIYMSDRKPKPGMTLNSVGLDVVTTCYNTDGLRDELFVQICRQTTDNHKRDSLRRGWELLAICLAFFPPSDKFGPYLMGYITRHSDPAYCSMFPDVAKWPIHIQVAHYAGVCMKRLERTTVNAKRQRLRKPTLEEIDLARLHIFRASMFGGTIEEVMALQVDRYPHRRLPWVQTTLSEEVLRLQGTNTEGIFRVPADFDEVHQLKQVVDQWGVGECGDAHVAAALLKLWYRELYEPLIPDSLYQAAINAHDDPHQAIALVNKLPDINRLVLSYLIRFLQYFAQPEIVTATKMDASNLAMVMAPNCLRCTSDDPRIIYENTRKEMAFLRTLIQNLDTTFMEGVV